MFAQRTINSIHSGSQFTGESFVLHALFPEENIGGVLVNVVIKGGVKHVALRETTSRTVEDFALFRMSTISILQEIDER